MRARLGIAVVAALSAAACSPSNEAADQRAAAGVWPPQDFAAFEARPPMSVGAELQDPWTLAINAERWSYVIGRAIVGVGAVPLKGAETPPDPDYVTRADRAFVNAAARLVALQRLVCARTQIAKQEDCAAFTPPPPWARAPQSKDARPTTDDLMSRDLWLNEHAPPFVQPACEQGAKRFHDERFCVAE